MRQSSYKELELCFLSYAKNDLFLRSLLLWKSAKGFRKITQKMLADDGVPDMYSFAAQAIDYYASNCCRLPQDAVVYRGMNVRAPFWAADATFINENFWACTPSEEGALNYSEGDHIGVLLKIRLTKGQSLGYISPVIEAQTYEDESEYDFLQEYGENGNAAEYEAAKKSKYVYSPLCEFVLPRKCTFRVTKITRKRDDAYVVDATLES